MTLRYPFVFALLGLSLGTACGGKTFAPTGDTGGAGGSATTGGSGGGTLPEAGSDVAEPGCSSTVDCPSSSWCDIEPAAPGVCASDHSIGTCKPRPSPGDCPDYDQCPGACACNGTWFCDACEAHAAGFSVTKDSTWCVPDAGTAACAPGFCQNAALSSCGDSSYTPLPAMDCVTPDGKGGYCCLPTCGGFGGEPCPKGAWCDYSGGPACGAVDNTGVCRPAESACPEDCPGVCGCNGSFYCNACYAHQDGQDITGDLSCQNDPGSPFLQNLQGIWLIGWSGGLNHFSWVRLRVDGGAGGQADFLSGKDMQANMPYWDCTGSGQWSLTAKPDTVGLYFPDACANLGFEALTFVSFSPPAGYPDGAILQASIESTSGVPLEGYKFPPDWCDPVMSSCADPFAW